jgi:hypothetical protein
MLDLRDVRINQFDRTNCSFELLLLLRQEILRIRHAIEVQPPFVLERSSTRILERSRNVKQLLSLLAFLRAIWQCQSRWRRKKILTQSRSDAWGD